MLDMWRATLQTRNIWEYVRKYDTLRQDLLIRKVITREQLGNVKVEIRSRCEWVWIDRARVNG